jgi:hypothetical protein
MRPSPLALSCVLALTVVPVSSRPKSPPEGDADPPNGLPGWFLGTWERDWIRKGGTTDSSVEVRYLQTPTMFGDVRVPRERPRLPAGGSWADLTDADLVILARQQGFFGFTTVAGDVATWHHEIDFQPPDPEVDRGRLERVGSSLLERGLDGSYTEHWWPLGSGDGRFLVVRVTKRAGNAQRLERVLLVAGDQFAYARNRPQDLPPSSSLSELIAASHAPRAKVLEYLDCELSEGRVRGGQRPWEIEFSTLPWRSGAHLELPDLIEVEKTGRLSAHGAPEETWSFPLNTFSSDDLRTLFIASH